jgi:nitroreductase
MNSQLSQTIKARATAKVLCPPETPLTPQLQDQALLEAMLFDAAQAPFHLPASPEHREALISPLPFRFYALNAQSCRALMAYLLAHEPTAGKITHMLAACDYLVLTTWLPDPAQTPLPNGHTFEGSLRNQEHLAASGAAIQNLLLLATEQGWQTYWSSGGVLGNEAQFSKFGISDSELLLGAIFLFPQNTENATVMPGALRDKRGSFTDFGRWIAF